MAPGVLLFKCSSIGHFGLELFRQYEATIASIVASGKEVTLPTTGKI